MHSNRKLPSAGLVVGVIAAVLALGGTAVAAKLITGKQVKDGSLQLKDLSKQARKKLAGVAGATGPAGAQGPTGATGPTGPKGETGAPGKDGVDGKNGVDGKDGNPSTAGRVVRSFVDSPMGMSANVNTEIASVELDVPQDAKYVYVAGHASFSLNASDANVVLWVTTAANCNTQFQPVFDEVDANKQITVSVDNVFNTANPGNTLFRLCARSGVVIQPDNVSLTALTVAASGTPII